MPDPLYIAARRVLLNALEALRPHLDALVLVGAQAVYVHAGEADVAVAPYTTDGDLAIDPTRLGAKPLLEETLTRAGFERQRNVVGIWQTSVQVEGTLRTVGVDLLVPDSLGGPGRRGARIPPHGRHTARKVVGLEGALVDRDRHVIGGLESGEARQVEMMVAGPAGLIVAKIHKIGERVGEADRASDKDALDVYRLLRAVPTEELARRFAVLQRAELARGATSSALAQLPQLFGTARAPGCVMAVRAAAALEPPDTLAASLVTLAADLRRAL